MKKNMVNKYDKNKIINIFVIVSILLSLVFLFLLIFKDDTNQLNVFYKKLEDLFGDFYNVLIYISNRNPYNNLLNGLGEKAYLPISYLILYPFSKVGGFSNYKYLEQCYTNLGIFLAFIFTLISVFMFMFSCNKLCEKYSITKKVLIPIYISGIFLYTIERGNLILISVSLLILFLVYYDSKNKYKRLFAAFCLALTTCLKFYPVVFGLLYLKEKRFKDAIYAAMFAIVIAFLPFLFFKGGFNNIGFLFRNMSLNSAKYNEVYMYSGMSVRNIVNYILYGKLKISENTTLLLGNISFYVLAVVIIISLFLSLINKNKFNSLSLMFFSTVFLQSNSRFYCIIYIIPIYLFMFKELDNNNYKKWIPLMAYFLLILMPIRININFIDSINPLNEYITVLLTLLFCMIICINAFKEFIANFIERKKHA